jgi:hypothetical protein
MTTTNIEKLKAFFMLWAVYLAMFIILAFVSMFVISPVFAYLRFGIFAIWPGAELVGTVARAVAIGSFGVTVAMWIFGELTLSK